MKQDKELHRQDYPQRIPIEGKFGHGKNGYRLNCIRAKGVRMSFAWILPKIHPRLEESTFGRGGKNANKSQARSICESEIIARVGCYHLSGLPNYNRFTEVMFDILMPIVAFMQGRRGKSNGIAFIDSMPLCVCKNIRIPRHKTLKEVAGRGKSSIGYFYGFKLYLMIDDCGKILSY